MQQLGELVKPNKEYCQRHYFGGEPYYPDCAFSPRAISNFSVGIDDRTLWRSLVARQPGDRRRGYLQPDVR